MAQDSLHSQSDPQPSSAEPRGFSEHTRRNSSENAHEQGWGLNEEERRHIPPGQQRRGGTDYEYGAQDFGDAPADTSAGQPASSPKSSPARSGSQTVGGEANRRGPARRKTA